MAISLADLHTTLVNTDTDSLADAIVNAPFTYKADMVLMGIGIIVLLVAGGDDGQIHRIALSDTELGDATKRISLKKFEDIKIPADYQTNIIARALTTGEPQMTPDWQYLFAPALSPEQARLNQAAGGIACSFVYPMSFNDTRGGLIFSFYKEPDAIDADAKHFMHEYSRTVAAALDARGATMQGLHPSWMD